MDKNKTVEEMNDLLDDDFEIICLEEMKEALAHEDLSSAVEKIKNYFEQLDCVELNIAVTGESGSGKSTFINAFRGMGDEDEDSAETGVVETTKVPTAYPYKKYPNVKLWDLPGIGTPNFQADDYLQQVEFQRYDLFIIIASDRFKTYHALLAAEIVKMQKRFYFVRSKIDANISAEKRKKTFNEQKTLDAIREDCIEGLKRTGVAYPVVFLITSFDLALFDFKHLEEKMEMEVHYHKKHLLILALPNIYLEINERKKKELEKDLWKLALLSARAASVTIPLVNSALSISVDVVILLKELIRYYNAFGIDPASLQMLADRSGKSVDELKSVLKSPLHARLNIDLVIKLMSESNTAVTKAAAEYFLGVSPILGSLAAGSLSFANVYFTLKHCLDGLYEDAFSVLLAVLQTPV